MFHSQTMQITSKEKNKRCRINNVYSYKRYECIRSIKNGHVYEIDIFLSIYYNQVLTCG